MNFNEQIFFSIFQYFYYKNEYTNSKAELRVTLRNDGKESYLPNVYGSRITIERKITKDTSTYKILNDKSNSILFVFFKTLFLFF